MLREYLKAWAKRKGWRLVGIEDRDIGKPAEFLEDVNRRAGLQKILNNPPGKYDGLIVWHNGMISRDLYQLLEILTILRKKGIKLV
jgi:DNA invertase Pin-like site-specific DNA recombinase